MTSKLSALLFLFSLSFTAQEIKLTLGSDVWPPFTNKDTKRAIALDIVRESLSRNNIESQQEIVEFNDVLVSIYNGTYDGSAALWKTPEREKSLIFSEPYLENRLILVGLKGTNVDYKSVKEFTNQSIGVVSNYAYEESLLNAQNISLVYGKSDQENLEKLFDRKIDFMLVDELLIQYLLTYQYNDVQRYLVISEEAFQTQKLYFALRKNIPNAKGIIENFNATIKKMMLDGTYNQILNLDIVQLDINGDGIVELIFNGNTVNEEATNSSYSIFYYDRSDKKRTQYYLNGKSYNSLSLMKKNISKASAIRVNNTNYDSGLKIKFD